MKKYFILLGCLFLFLQPGKACDICGCGTMYLPGGAQFRAKQNLLSIVFEQSNFKSFHVPSILKSSEGADAISEENFVKLRFAGQWAFYKNIHINWNIPYQQVAKNGAGSERVQGLGDISLGINSPLYMDSLGGALTFLIGNIALKLPTGNYQESLVTESVSRYMLPGSGSFDANFSLSYTYLKNKWSGFVQTSYRLNGRSKGGIAWGDVYSIASEVWRFEKLKNANKLGFKAMMIWEQRDKDKQFERKVPFTGYSVLQGGLGTSYFFKSFSIDLTFYRPLYQHFPEDRVFNKSNFQLKIQCYL